MTLLDLVQVNIQLQRVARTNGGEYAGPCPFCGGRDRFRVWPNQAGGRYWCRVCGKHGDAIQWLRDTRGLSFREACAELEIDPRSRPETQRTAFTPREITPANALWQKKTDSFLAQARWDLWKNQDALRWLHGRGLAEETIEAADLGWNLIDLWENREAWGLEPEKNEKGKDKKLWLPAGLVIPLIENGQVKRLRIRRPEGKSRYVIVSGSDTRPMVFDQQQRNFVMVESDLDGLLINQEAGDLVGTVALGSVQIKPDEDTDRLLRQAALILVSLDFDEAGAKASWGYWIEKHGHRAKRWPVPVGKDPGEAFQKGLSIRAWVEAGLNNKSLSLQSVKPTETVIKPFPKEWLQRYDETQLERLAIMTVDGRLSDQEAMRLLN